MQFPPGTKVRVDSLKYPGVWIVKSNGPKNVTLVPADGGRGLRCPHSWVRLDDGAPYIPPPVESFCLGETVLINGGRFPGVYVVVKDAGGERLNVAKLGGDGDRYVRAVRSQLQRITVNVTSAEVVV